ncbi:MAG: SHOCT domain-containing protein [Turicibacter sp.]|nr:SHOCT domain-containing protein [Turicibacter sp.]
MKKGVLWTLGILASLWAVSFLPLTSDEAAAVWLFCFAVFVAGYVYLPRKLSPKRPCIICYQKNNAMSSEKTADNHAICYACLGKMGLAADGESVILTSDKDLILMFIEKSTCAESAALIERLKFSTDPDSLALYYQALEKAEERERAAELSRNVSLGLVSSGISAELRQLKQLEEDGIITAAEFEQKKKQLLGL